MILRPSSASSTLSPLSEQRFHHCHKLHEITKPSMISMQVRPAFHLKQPQIYQQKRLEMHFSPPSGDPRHAGKGSMTPSKIIIQSLAKDAEICELHIGNVLGFQWVKQGLDRDQWQLLVTPSVYHNHNPGIGSTNQCQGIENDSPSPESNGCI